MKKIFQFVIGALIFAGLFEIYGYGQTNFQEPNTAQAQAGLLGMPWVMTPRRVKDYVSGAIGGPFAANAMITGTGTGLQATTSTLTSTTMALPSTLTNGFQIYNTTDQTTNYERLSLLWSGNVALVSGNFGGTGNPQRTLRFGVGSVAGSTALSTYIEFVNASGSPVKIVAPSNASTTYVGLNFSTTQTAASGTIVGASITPTYNQSASTAANTDLLINRTQTAVGSGTQRLIDAQVGGSSKFNVDNTGIVFAANYVYAGEVRNVGGVLTLNNTSVSGASALVNMTGSLTGANVAQQGFLINTNPTGQSGTSAFTDLLVNRNGVSGGSGAQRLLDLQVSGTTKFYVDNFGNVLNNAAIQSNSATAGVGYAGGAGGTVAQASSRTTGVTLNKVCGQITLVSAAGTTAWQTFTVTNSAVAVGDVIVINQKSGTDLYEIHITAVAAGSFNVSYKTTSGTTVEQPVFTFAVVKAVSA